MNYDGTQFGHRLQGAVGLWYAQWLFGFGKEVEGRNGCAVLLFCKGEGCHAEKGGKEYRTELHERCCGRASLLEGKSREKHQFPK